MSNDTKETDAHERAAETERERAEREPVHPGWSHLHTGKTYAECAAAKAEAAK